jgi:hypothetical protein
MSYFDGYYFKQGEGLISGVPLPDEVKDAVFYHCDFHPNCESVKFINCSFECCEGTEYLNKVDCAVR